MEKQEVEKEQVGEEEAEKVEESVATCGEN